MLLQIENGDPQGRHSLFAIVLQPVAEQLACRLLPQVHGLVGGVVITVVVQRQFNWQSL